MSLRVGVLVPDREFRSQKTKVPGEKPALVQFLSLHMSHEFPWDWTQANTVRSEQQLRCNISCETGMWKYFLEWIRAHTCMRQTIFVGYTYFMPSLTNQHCVCFHKTDASPWTTVWYITVYCARAGILASVLGNFRAFFLSFLKFFKLWHTVFFAKCQWRV